VKLVLRRPIAALVAVPVLTMAGAGCTGLRTQTQNWYVPGDGVSTEAGDIGVRNVLLVADDDGGIATLIATFANEGATDELVEVQVGDQAVVPPTGALEIPADGYARLGPDGVRLDVEGADVQPGDFVDVEFVFGNAPRAEVQALVQRAEGDYEDALDFEELPTPTPL
jgi:hypothetical protein